MRIAAEQLDLLCQESGDELQLFLEYEEGSFLAWFRLFSQVPEPPPHLKGVIEVTL